MRRSEDREGRLVEIEVIVGEVENSTQTHLTEEERTALAIDLYKTMAPVEEIRRWGENVRRSPDRFAKISLDVWLGSVQLYTSEEIQAIVNQRIEAQREKFIKFDLKGKFDEGHLARAGLVAVDQYFRRQWYDLLEKEKDRQVKVFERKQRSLSKMNAVTIRDLYTQCVAEGLIKRDSFAESREDYMRIYLRSKVVVIAGKIDVLLKRMKS